MKNYSHNIKWFMDFSRSKDSLVTNCFARSYILSKVLAVPFWSLLYLLPVLLKKELNATPFQVATLVMLKPVTALFSPYWSFSVGRSKKGVFLHLWLGTIIKYIPFLFLPFLSSTWFFLFAFAFYMFFLRATTPIWIELLKRHTPLHLRGKLVAIGSTVDYLGGVIFPILMRFQLLFSSISLKGLFVGSALLGISAFFSIISLKNRSEFFTGESDASIVPREGIKKLQDKILYPWKESVRCLRDRPDFFLFQIGFFCGGAGLMLVQPVIPIYCTQYLDLSYSDILLGISGLKGIGFACSSPFWLRFFNRSKIFLFSGCVTFLASLFHLLLFCSLSFSYMFYFAFFLYGVMQGGSELSWKMSGVVFAKNEKSIIFSSVSNALIGIRGLIFPYLGSLLFYGFGNTMTIYLSAFLCFLGGVLLLRRGACERDNEGFTERG